MDTCPKLLTASVARPDQVEAQFARTDVTINVVTVGISDKETLVYCRNAAVFGIAMLILHGIDPMIEARLARPSDVKGTLLLVAQCDEEVLARRGFADVCFEDLSDLYADHVVSPLWEFGHPNN
jgi:hypothetical protein